VIHLAARTDLLEVKDIRRYEANYEGTTRLIDACSRSSELKRVVFASSRMVCRIGYSPKHDADYCPPNLYGESKVRTELVVREARPPFEWLIVRPTSIWGPWFDVPYRTFFTTIANRTYLQPQGHNPPKAFGFVGNTVYQYERLLLAPRADVAGVTTYQCDYPPLFLMDWADSIRRAMKLGPIPTVPVPLLRVLARIGDGLAKVGWTRAPLTTFRLENLLSPMVFDTTLLSEVCGALPFTLGQGVERTVAWLRQH
jgi:nucleoside-diphosphate-sugar epimerase